MKKFLPAFVFCLLTAFAASAALAQAPEGQELTHEDYAKYQALAAAHCDKMITLKDAFWAKEMEYHALANNSTTSRSDIQALIADMGKIKKQMRETRKAYRDDLKAKGWSHFARPGHGHGSAKHFKGHGPAKHHGPHTIHGHGY